MNQSRRSDEAYDHPRENGWHPDDQTAYLASQQHWGLAEQHRPDILFQWKPDGHQDPPYTPGDWICPWTGEPKWNGKTGDFFKDWRDIPQQLSSRVEGWLMEAISRTDSRIKIDDFLVRIRDDVEDKPTTTNRLQMRKKRFREVYKLRTWNASRAEGQKHDPGFAAGHDPGGHPSTQDAERDDASRPSPRASKHWTTGCGDATARQWKQPASHSKIEQAGQMAQG
ncbi:MAG: hypothetical protein M1832_001592 [Thelocarpon impressellum]|nr:MAG: hypothetical protein M1832_001592 [Thelocarpon impressellum]